MFGTKSWGWGNENQFISCVWYLKEIKRWRIITPKNWFLCIFGELVSHPFSKEMNSTSYTPPKNESANSHTSIHHLASFQILYTPPKIEISETPTYLGVLLIFYFSSSPLSIHHLHRRSITSFYLRSITSYLGVLLISSFFYCCCCCVWFGGWING